MAATKVSTNQMTLNPFKVLYTRVNNGTGTRTNFTSATPVALACTGDTSYTAPANQDVDIKFTMTQMGIVTSGVLRLGLSINGVEQNELTYHTWTGWQVQTIGYKISVNAGQTITIGCKGRQEGGGTGTITNATTDPSFPNSIVGIVVPRGS